MDHAGQMRWQAMAREKARKAARKKFVNNKVLLAHLEAHDPLFRHVKHFVESFIASLSGKLRRPLLEEIERVPGTFLDMYVDLREHLVREFDLHGQARIFTQQVPPRSHF